MSSLATGRQRRSTAGNRMRALLDGVFEAEEGFEEIENDEEFEDKGDLEGDVYESDFQSTDEEDVDQAVDAGEKQILAEAREARKQARRKMTQRIDGKGSGVLARFKPGRATALLTGQRDENPSGSGNSQPAPKKRRYTGPVVEFDEEGEMVDNATRRSSRSAAVQSKAVLLERLKESHGRKVASQKRVRAPPRVKTQAELIADALATEESNIASLNTFLTEEEERRLKNAQLKKTVIDGPVLRWISRAEQTPIAESKTSKPRMIVEVEIPLRRPTPDPVALARMNSVPPSLASASNHPLIPSSSSTASITPYGIPPPPPPRTSTPPANAFRAPSQTPSASANRMTASPTSPAVPRLERQARNYVTLTTPKDTPVEDDYAHLFGDHVDWGELEVLSRHHPAYKPPESCAITGLPASYRDPETYIPYATIQAFQTIRALVRHEYVWSEGLEMYIGDGRPSVPSVRTQTGGGTGGGEMMPSSREEGLGIGGGRRGAVGVPSGWEEAVSGGGVQHASVSASGVGGS